MAKAEVHLLLELTIHDGQFESFQAVANEMIAGTQGEAGTMAYEWFLSGDPKHCRLLESYATVDALLAHLTGPVVQQLVPKMMQYVAIDRSQVYGDPGPEAAKILASFGAPIFHYWAGLDR